MKIYMIGIKGSGMSALAIMLRQRGNFVIGSDKNIYSYTSENLKLNGIEVLNYNINNLKEDYYYIIQGENDSIEARYVKENYQWSYYFDFIGSLKNFKSIAISGTHGKTTTTSIFSHIFKDSNCLIGNSYGRGNIKSNQFIFEACEYKDHFLKYYPTISIILNVEMDHVDYFKSIDQLKESFMKFASQSKLCIFNGDDIKLKGISFGYNLDNDYIIDGKTIIHNSKKYKIEYEILSKKMMYDICSVYIVCELYGIDFNTYIKGFKMPLKRFNEYQYKSNYLIDDFAHHPTELENVLEMIKTKYNKKPVIIFEPHQYDRIVYFQNEFYNILKDYESYIMPLYNARSNVNHNIDFFVKQPLKEFKYFDINNYQNDVILFASATKTINYILKECQLVQ